MMINSIVFYEFHFHCSCDTAVIVMCSLLAYPRFLEFYKSMLCTHIDAILLL